MSNTNDLSTTTTTTTTLPEDNYTAYSQDGKIQLFKPDIVVRDLTPEQHDQWKVLVKNRDDEYFLTQTIGVAMTQEQHEEIDEFIKDTFSKLNQENNFEHESINIFFTTHFIDQIRRRKRKKIDTSYKHREVLRKYVAEFDSVEDVFRWGSSGVSYRLFNKLNQHEDDLSGERITIAISPAEDGKGIDLEIALITYFVKQRKKKKKKAAN